MIFIHESSLFEQWEIIEWPGRWRFFLGLLPICVLFVLWGVGFHFSFFHRT